jgi:5-methylcytosine-specific restriction protein A
MPTRFELGRSYRRTDLHDEYGGQWQSGIVTPREHPLILIFTGESGERHGYRDEWTDDGTFVYTGEGQVGDMQFVRGNRAIRDHVFDGKELHVFEVLEKPRSFVRYKGQFTADSWHFEPLPDREGATRQGIRFHLVPVDDERALHAVLPMAPDELELQLAQLRERAFYAARDTVERSPSEAKRSYIARSAAVARYVLARADGRCEACREPAPFAKLDGSPYLEPHHTRRLADGGPDDPRWVAAVCPTCHRWIHYGTGGEARNTELEKALREIEPG